MTTRRQFLQGSLATTGLAFAGSALGPGWAPLPGESGARLALQGMVHEPRLAQSASFAAAARRLGLPVFGIDGDITPVWSQLQALWRDAPAAIGGLTTFTPLMLLEQSGRDHGLRVMFRAEHRGAADGGTAHALSGPREVLRAFGLAAERGTDFGACSARAMLRCPASADGKATATLRTPTPTHGVNDRTLYSWVLAPRHARTNGAHA